MCEWLARRKWMFRTDRAERRGFRRGLVDVDLFFFLVSFIPDWMWVGSQRHRPRISSLQESVCLQPAAVDFNGRYWLPVITVGHHSSCGVTRGLESPPSLHHLLKKASTNSFFRFQATLITTSWAFCVYSFVVSSTNSSDNKASQQLSCLLEHVRAVVGSLSLFFNQHLTT